MLAALITQAETNSTTSVSGTLYTFIVFIIL